MSEAIPNSQETAREIEQDPAGVVRRWLMEISIADKEEREWRKEGQDIWDRYKGNKQKKDSFNILYRRTSRMSQQEMRDLIDFAESWALENGVELRELGDSGSAAPQCIEEAA